MQKKKTYSFKKIIRYTLLFLAILVGLFLFYTYAVLQPRNDREWEIGFEKLPEFTITNNKVTIKNFRDYRYTPGKIVSFGHIDRTIDVDKIEKVWFVVEPFSQYPGVAHTYFVFDIKDAEPVAVSVEARREKGEVYGATKGLLNQFELIYVWGSEKDETIGRVMMWDDKLYMYPTTLSKKWAKALFLQLAKDSHRLEITPRFYNSLLNNCTNELAKTANRVKPGSIPFTIAHFLPAYSAQELYKLGFIPNDISLEKLTEKYNIYEAVKKLYKKEDFSKALRSELNK